ncbi:MAG: HNH endonuclease, partial [Verrucomicrobiae bacterium]|nr:HNH endonuclease [Verrucomicrobiae bacterium]
RAALANLLGIDLDADDGDFPPPEPATTHATRKRDTRFAFEVLPAYDFTCALTGYRMVAEDGTTILDAAHIRSFKHGGPCLARNGLALSKTAHWLFDRGFWSLDDDLHILVKQTTFHESGDAALLLKPKDGNRIRVPNLATFHPDTQHLAWHRKQHGF